MTESGKHRQSEDREHKEVKWRVEARMIGKILWGVRHQEFS